MHLLAEPRTLASPGLPVSACRLTTRLWLLRDHGRAKMGPPTRIAGPPEECTDVRLLRLTAAMLATTLCEGCGARFEDLEAYRVHLAGTHYR